ncbi:fused signal recognition particle receptor [Candidatus Nanopelagicus limnes]|uniref:Signal recognition particle receptor FtsY n=1 Tax=Candidatus Nanopelagicus limnae TaxID=1884634 RepID=A0A249JYB7_9ACTN|nr:signal recognition particle-docking protein FtsY [Candidatus Nanopelagicus limnes]ASY09506.1 fused signal recognition particle receptor [Candidatus Nanopelagicus limnes]
MSLFKRLFNAVRSGSVSNEQWDDIRSNLISADLGVKLVDQVIAEAKSAKPENAQQSITYVIKQWLSSKDRAIAKNSDRVSTILVVGVNGTGKTTSTAKLANLIKNEKNTVLLAAADTFRAAAVDQLQTWASRIDIEVVSGAANGDPAAVAFSAITKAKSENYNYLLVDTAGRLHTKENLMQELGKVIRVIEKQSPVDEILLVLDATTGQNGINQAKVFIEAAGVTGFILTKLDGSAKGGVGLAIEKEFGLPIKFIGTGEQISDLAPFDPEQYIASLFD